MITPRKLGDIIAFQKCHCQLSAPNLEKYRSMVGELLEAYEDSVSLNLRLLPIEEYKQGKLNDIVEEDTVKKTIVEHLRLREIFQEGRTR